MWIVFIPTISLTIVFNPLNVLFTLTMKDRITWCEMPLRYRDFRNEKSSFIGLLGYKTRPEFVSGNAVSRVGNLIEGS